MTDRLQPTWYDATTRKKAWKKFALCLARKEHEHMLGTLDKDIKNLKSLTNDSVDLERVRSARRGIREPFGKVRNCAKSLHKILKASWSCTCRSPHRADMRLEMRESQDDLSFRILFPDTGDSQSADNESWIWHDTEIRPLDRVDVSAEEIPSGTMEVQSTSVSPFLAAGRPSSHAAIVTAAFQKTSAAGPLHGNSNIPFRQHQNFHWTKKVSWAPDVEGQRYRNEPNTRAVVGPQVTSPLDRVQAQAASADLKKISNMCHALREVRSQQRYEECFGCLVDETLHSGAYTVLSNPFSGIQDQNPTTLKDLLDQSFNAKSMHHGNTPHLEAKADRPSLTKRSRLRIAVTLVSAALQLHTTPWLKKNWGKEDILFHNGSAQHPYISKSFAQGNPTISETDGMPSEEDSWTPIRNKSIFNLGVLLLELAFGKPLSTFRIANDPPFFTEYAIACRLVGQLAEEESSGYSDAARACVYCDFGTKVKTLDFDNEAFKQALYDDVLIPLEDDWKHWNRCY